MWRCKKCGRTFHEFKPKGHFFNGKICDGELEEGKLVWEPTTATRVEKL